MPEGRRNLTDFPVGMDTVGKYIKGSAGSVFFTYIYQKLIDPDAALKASSTTLKPAMKVFKRIDRGNGK